jgi:membrane-bound lytic murein transglycosylase MltF
VRIARGASFAFALAATLAVTCLSAVAASAAQPAPAKDTAAAKPRQLAIANKRWTGDFDRMLERRMIRVAAPYSRSLYFNDKGRERGLSAELARDFERWLNQKYAKQLGKRPLTVYLYPATRDRLLQEVEEGMADISIGNLTVTEERRKLVDFVAPADIASMDEILVTGPTAPAVASAADLSAQTVHVRRGAPR